MIMMMMMDDDDNNDNNDDNNNNNNDNDDDADNDDDGHDDNSWYKAISQWLYRSFTDPAYTCSIFVVRFLAYCLHNIRKSFASRRW